MAFDEAGRLLQQAVTERVFPAAVAEIGRETGVLWRETAGALTYDEDAAPTTHDTIFDLASLTKVIATTTLAMRLVDDARLTLDDRVQTRLAEWRGGDREHVTVRDLLEHASGLTAHLPF